MVIKEYFIAWVIEANNFIKGVLSELEKTDFKISNYNNLEMKLLNSAIIPEPHPEINIKKNDKSYSLIFLPSGQFRGATKNETYTLLEPEPRKRELIIIIKEGENIIGEYCIKICESSDDKFSYSLNRVKPTIEQSIGVVIAGKPCEVLVNDLVLILPNK